jgi:hypothetical protein
MTSNDKTAGERRAETARENDDSDIIEAAEDELMPGQKGVSGGDLQRAIAAEGDSARVRDPAARDSRTKEDEMAEGDFSPGPRSATEVVSERKDRR